MLLVILVLLLLYYFITEYNSDSGTFSSFKNSYSGFTNRHLTSYKDDNEFYVDKSLFMPLINENLTEKRMGKPLIHYGNYGDVPVGIYKESDLKTSKECTRSDAVYVPNTAFL